MDDRTRIEGARNRDVRHHAGRSARFGAGVRPGRAHAALARTDLPRLGSRREGAGGAGQRSRSVGRAASFLPAGRNPDARNAARPGSFLRAARGTDQTFLRLRGHGACDRNRERTSPSRACRTAGTSPETGQEHAPRPRSPAQAVAGGGLHARNAGAGAGPVQRARSGRRYFFVGRAPSLADRVGGRGIDFAAGIRRRCATLGADAQDSRAEPRRAGFRRRRPK